MSPDRHAVSHVPAEHALPLAHSVPKALQFRRSVFRSSHMPRTLGLPVGHTDRYSRSMGFLQGGHPGGADSWPCANVAKARHLRLQLCGGCARDELNNAFPRSVVHAVRSRPDGILISAE